MSQAEVCTLMPIFQMKKLRTAVTEGLAQGHAVAHCIVTLGAHGLPDPDRMHYIVYYVCISLHDTS